MRRLLLLALLAPLLAAPTSATAAPYVDWLPVIHHAAVDYWGHGQLPSCGQPRDEWVHAATLVEDHPDSPYRVDADADPDTCVIRWSLEHWGALIADPPSLCLLVLHEVGHLYGRPHSDAPYNIMNPAPAPDVDPMRYSACRRAIAITYRHRGGLISLVMRPRS